MRKSVTSFALLSTLNSTTKKSYIEMFVPFLATLFVKKKIAALDESQIHLICGQFKEFFDLKISPQAMISILQKARKVDLINKRKKSYIVNEDIAHKLDFSKSQHEFDSKNIAFKEEFKHFCLSEFNLIIEHDEIDSVMLSFLRRNDIELLITNSSDSLIGNNFALTKKLRRFEKAFNKFLIVNYEKKNELFDYFLDISFGHIIASTITLDNYDYSQDTVKNCNIYIDSPLIFNIIGTDGEHKQRSARLLVNSIIKNGGNVKIFKHNLEEVETNLNLAIEALESKKFDYVHSNLTAKNYKHLGYTADEVVNIKNTLRTILSNYQIVERPNYEDSVGSQIDSKRFEKKLRSIYHIENDDINMTIKNDLCSIEAIYHLREERAPKLVSEAKYIFLTSNYGFVRANIEYINTDSNLKGTIPASLTDVFLGTLLWINSQKEIEYNKERFIATCYNAIRPSYELKSKFLSKIEKLKNDKAIIKESPLLLNESKELDMLLFSKTLGDPDLITEKSIFEIEEEYKTKVEAPLKKELIDKESKITNLNESIFDKDEVIEELQDNQEEFKDRTKTLIIKRVGKIALFWQNIFKAVTLAIALLIVFAGWIGKVYVYKLWDYNKLYSIIFGVIFFSIIYLIRKYPLKTIENKLVKQRTENDSKIKELKDLLK